MKKILAIMLLAGTAANAAPAQQKRKKPMPQHGDTAKVAVPMNAIKSGNDSMKYRMPVVKPDSSRNEQMPVVRPKDNVVPK